MSEIVTISSPSAEESILSAILCNSDRLDELAGKLQPEMFFDDVNRVIYSAIVQMVQSNKPVEPVTVHEYLTNMGFEVSLSHINEITFSAPGYRSLDAYVEIVAEKWLIRGLLDASMKAHEIATQSGLETKQRLDQCQQLFQNLASQKTTKEPRHLSAFAVELIDHVNDVGDGKIAAGVGIGIPTLDNLLGGGFKPMKQVIIAARPGVGKSALALEIAYQFAKAGHGAAFLSQEMTGMELASRLACRIGKVNAQSIATAKFVDDEGSRFTESIEQFRGLPIYIDDQAGLSLAEIQAKARKLKRQHNIKVLILDYLQLCAASDKKLSRHHQIEELSRGLKVLSKQLEITTVVLSQLSREVEKRTSNRAILADLKESGSIEEDADVVMLLSPEGQLPTGDMLIHCEVAKNRGGPKGRFVKLGFAGQHQWFYETTVSETNFKPKKPTEFSNFS